MSSGIYVASKTRLAPLWRELRSEGAPIISTWIDEAGAGGTDDFSDLWLRCICEVTSAAVVLACHEPGDVWKGAFLEVGAAFASGTPVALVGEPPGTWPAHPLVVRFDSVPIAMPWAVARTIQFEADPSVAGEIERAAGDDTGGAT